MVVSEPSFPKQIQCLVLLTTCVTNLLVFQGDDGVGHLVQHHLPPMKAVLNMVEGSMMQGYLYSTVQTNGLTSFHIEIWRRINCASVSGLSVKR